MKKLFYLGFCLVLVMAFGCAITDYGTITDNDQTQNGQGNGTINTNGKAHILESSQVATIWSDGSDELFSFIDQKGDGTATLTTYNNFSSGSDPTFHDDFYCNPDWQGCSIFTAQDDNDGNLFDGVGNTNCFGWRSISVLLSSGRYYGECGRQRLSLEDKLNFAALGELRQKYGHMGLLYNLNSSNTSLFLDNGQGSVAQLPLRGNAEFWMSGERNVASLDLTNPLMGQFGRAYANWLADNGTGQTTATLCVSGVCADFVIAGNTGPSTPHRINANVNAHY